MKKIISIICIVLLCSCINVNASNPSPKEACELKSNESIVCTISENGECNCRQIIEPNGVDRGDY